jgi:sulfate-transporting ATPase
VTSHVNFLLLGLGNGAVFAALALAVVVTYRGSGVLNFATGALALLGAYTYAFLREGELLIPLPPLPETIDLGHTLGFWRALAITMVVQAVVGLVLYVAVFRPLRHARPAAKAVASLGVMVLLTAILVERVGDAQVLVEPIFPARTYTAGGIRLTGDRFWFAVTVVAVAVVLAAVFRFTRFGIATRAAAESELGAYVTGLSPDRIAMGNWAISAMVAGLAGILIAPLTPLLPGMYTLFIVPALAAAVLGRFTAILPAVLGGLLIGMLQSEATFLRSRYDWFPQNGAAELIPLLLILVVLLLRSQPLPRRGELVEQTLGRAPRLRSPLLPLALGVPAAVAALYLTDGSYRGALILTFIMGVVSLSLVVVTGFVGQISLAQLTLAGVAAFLLSPLTDSWGVPFPVAPILAALGATVIGVVVGLPALRIRGLLVAVVTLSLAVTLEAVWFRNNDLNGGTEGLNVPAPRLFGLDLGIGAGEGYPRPAFGLLCLGVLVLIALGVVWLRISRLGSAMLAVRANERSAAATGISVVRTKLIGFALGAFIAGIGGCLLAYKQTNVTWESYSALLGLLVFSTAYLAGITSVSGALAAGVLTAGGITFVALDRLVDLGEWYTIATGVLLVFTVIKNPEGIVGPVHMALERRRRALATPAAEQPAAGTPASPPLARTMPPADDAGAAVPLLRVQHLRVTYGGVVAVHDVSFDLPAGVIAGLIGPNGAGKTTLMDALCGFTPYDGSVVLGGQPLDGLPPHRRARAGIGRTFQGIDLYNDLSILENVLAGAPASRSDRGLRSRRHEAVDRVLGDLELLADRDRPVGELSQGRRQLVSIARALVGRPQLLMLDEPAAGLDTNESEWLARRLRRICDAGTTILLVDHDMSLVLGLCDQVHVLDFGSLIASGPPESIVTDRQVTEAYLGATHAHTAAAGELT